MRAVTASGVSAGGAFEPVRWEGDNTVLLRARERGEARRLLAAFLHSKAMARRVLGRGQLTRDGIVLPSEAMVEPGELLALSLHVPEGLTRRACGEVQVVYQDRLLLAANKPAGLLVHGDGTGADTLTARVQGLLARQGRAVLAQAVQRLDMDTTGLVLFSLAEEFQPALDAQVAGHDMRKAYLAVIEGRLSGAGCGWLELSAPIGRDRHDARRMRVSPSGKSALTRVRTLSYRNGLSLLEVELGSGRRHQIRVHLAHEGHPLLGDALYGGARHAEGLMLHAFEERLVHPLTGERLALRAPAPDRFRHLFG